jgi:SAM-dependent methyltransferase
MRVCVACGTRFDSITWFCPSCQHEPARLDGITAFAPAIAAINEGDAVYRHTELARAEDGHFWFIARKRLITWALRTYFPHVRSFFDVGCGTGSVLAAVGDACPHLRLGAGDALLEAIKVARSRVAGGSFVQLDIRRLPFDSEFDVVGLFDVLEHLDDDEHVLRELYRSVTPGGGIIVTVPQHRWLWSAVDEYSGHRRRYTRRELVARVRAAGFTVERTTSFMTLLLPVLALARRFKRDIDHLDPVAELTIGRIPNRVFASLCALEGTAIRAGANFPFGGSLLLIARKA